jgi:hypothetical protein
MESAQRQCHLRRFSCSKQISGWYLRLIVCCPETFRIINFNRPRNISDYHWISKHRRLHYLIVVENNRLLNLDCGVSGDSIRFGAMTMI